MAGTALEVSTTDLARHLGEYLSRVRFGGDVVVVMKSRVPVAELRPLGGRECSLRSFIDLWVASPPDAAFADDLDAVNNADRPLVNPWA